MSDERNGTEQGVGMTNGIEERVRRFVDLAQEIADNTGIPVAQVERALIYEAARSEGNVNVFLDFVHSVVSGAKQFIGEWTRRVEQRK